MSTENHLEITTEEIQEYSSQARIHLNSMISINTVKQINEVLATEQPSPEKIGDTVRRELQALFPIFNFSLPNAVNTPR